MVKAWMFVVTLMALYLTASANEPLETERHSYPCIFRYNCTTDCERFKCQDLGGYCINTKWNPDGCPGYIHYSGRGDWCQFYRVCKCCIQDCEHGGFRPGPTEPCICQPCYNGSLCQDYYCIDKCQNGGTCTGPCECTCPSGWTGPTCEEYECDPECQNNGICTGPNECTCPLCYTGSRCQDFYCIEECQNGGTCTGPCECTCAPGYYGDICQYIQCEGASNCIDNNGICYDQNDPILANSTACPSTNMGKPWCGKGSLRTCSCCYGA